MKSQVHLVKMKKEIDHGRTEMTKVHKPEPREYMQIIIDEIIVFILFLSPFSGPDVKRDVADLLGLYLCSLFLEGF